MMNSLHILPCLDSEGLAETCRRALDIPRPVAVDLGQSAVAVSKQGFYWNRSGIQISIAQAVDVALAQRRDFPPDEPLPIGKHSSFAETRIQIANETTFLAARRLQEQGLRPLVLNFANGVSPGGGFLHGARAQEETLCRSSALYLTLVGDPMYEAHAKLPHRYSSDWCILSPGVPVFREDDGTPLEQPWNLDFITCAAPYCDYSPKDVANATGSGASDSVLLAVRTCADLLRQRIRRVLAIAEALGYEALVLGAWGCGAFNNDSAQTAADFRAALESDFQGSFSDIVFAIADWSPERRWLGPFRSVFTN